MQLTENHKIHLSFNSSFIKQFIYVHVLMISVTINITDISTRHSQWGPRDPLTPNQKKELFFFRAKLE